MYQCVNNEQNPYEWVRFRLPLHLKTGNRSKKNKKQTFIDVAYIFRDMLWDSIMPGSEMRCFG